MGFPGSLKRSFQMYSNGMSYSGSYELLFVVGVGDVDMVVVVSR